MAANRFKWADALRDDSNVDAYAMAVAFALFLHMDKNGKCRPSVDTIAREAHLAKATALDRLNELRDSGWLEWEDRGRNVSRRYEAIIPSGSPHELPTGSHGELASGSSVVHPRPPSGSPGVLEPPTNLSEVGGEGTQPASADATAAASQDNNDKKQSMIEFLKYVWEPRTHSNSKPDPKDPDVPPDYWWGDRVGYSDIDTVNPDLLSEVRRLHQQWNDWELVSKALRRPPREPHSPTGWLLKVLRSLPDDPNDNPDALRVVEARKQRNAQIKRLKNARALLQWVAYNGGFDAKTWEEKLAEADEPEAMTQALQTCVERRWLLEEDDGIYVDYLGTVELGKIEDGR